MRALLSWSVELHVVVALLSIYLFCYLFRLLNFAILDLNTIKVHYRGYLLCTACRFFCHMVCRCACGFGNIVNLFLSLFFSTFEQSHLFVLSITVNACLRESIQLGGISFYKHKF